MGGIAVVLVYCRCWPWRALAVALPWYLLLYNSPLSDSMFDSRCSTVSNMRTELSSGWFKNVCFSSMCVYMCECVTARIYPSFLPASPPTDTHGFPKLEQPCHLSVLTFVSLFFLASGVLTFTLKWSSKCLNLFCCDDTDWRVHWFKWTQMSFIFWCKHLFKGAPFPWSVLTSHHGEIFGSARVAKSTASETMAMSEIEH